MPVGPDPLLTRTLRERLGGRWAIAWQSYLITAGLGLIALLAGEEHFRSSTSIALSWVMLSLASSAAVGILLLVLNATVFRNRRVTPVPIWLVVAVDALCGVIFGLVVGLGATLLGLDTNLGTLERVVLDAVYGAWWGPTFTYFLDYREQAVTVRRELIAASVQTELAALQQVEVVERLRQELRDEVGQELSPVRTRVEAHLAESAGAVAFETHVGTADVQEVSDLLRGTAESSVRPLSKRLWNESSERYPRTPWWSLAVNIVRYQPFRPIMYAAVDVLGTGFVQVRLFGLARGIFLTSAMVLLIFLVMLSANAVMRAFPRWHTAIFIGGIVALQITLVVRVHFRELWLPGSAPLGWQVTQLVVGTLVVLITSGFGAWSDKSAELRANFRADIRQDQVESIARSRQVAELARETAQLLHGTVQTRLVSCAMALDKASATGDQAAVNSALQEVLVVLAEPMPQPTYVGTIAEEVERKAALWEGLCEFTVRVDDTAGSQASVMAVGRVVEEAISNAIRHGGASHIDISVASESDGSVRVVVDDDGRGPGGGVPGIGTAYLQQASAGRWSLKPLPRGSRLEVLVPA